MKKRGRTPKQVLKTVQRKHNFALPIIGFAIIVIVAAVWSGGAEKRATHRKAEALGLFGAPWQIEARHVSISEHNRGVGRYGDVDVHIMTRANSNDVWQLCGTGNLLGKRPGYMLTAYHVFENKCRQYGCRKISPKEFTGKEQIIPIISCQSEGNADDSVICSVDSNRLDFPDLKIPTATKMFHKWATTNYNARTWPVKIHFNTYPEITINNLLYIEMGNGAFHYIFDWPVVPGESGTNAHIEGEREDVYLVIIRGQQIPKTVIDQLSPENKLKADWSPGKFYGVGNLVLLHPTPK